MRNFYIYNINYGNQAKINKKTRLKNQIHYIFTTLQTFLYD